MLISYVVFWRIQGFLQIHSLENLKSRKDLTHMIKIFTYFQDLLTYIPIRTYLAPMVPNNQTSILNVKIEHNYKTKYCNLTKKFVCL